MVTKLHMRLIHYIIEVGFDPRFDFRIRNVFFYDLKKSKYEIVFGRCFAQGASKVHHISVTIGPMVTKLHMRLIHDIIEVGFEPRFDFRIRNVFFYDLKKK